MKLNLGCDQWKLEHFVNIDCDISVNPDVVADAARLPFRDDTFDEIYAGHILEHMHDPDLALIEWRRVLKPGGVITVTVPDIERGLEEYRARMISLDWLNQIAFGSEERDGQHHQQIFTDDILIDFMCKYFQNVKIIDDCPHLVARVRWQTIAEGKKGDG